MAILQDSVLVGGFFFFLSTYLLYFSTKKISESQISEKNQKKLNILCFAVFILIVILIFAYHSSHYMSNLNG
jgi:formate hydrogenlyase subunit 3/multisubunit Na+/H+ antiporter MnhD subunit